MEKLKTMTYEEVIKLMDDSEWDPMDADSGSMLSSLISPWVCMWWQDHHDRGQFRAVEITSLNILRTKDNTAELVINFDILLSKKKGGVKKLPHFGMWELRKIGGFIQPFWKFTPDGNEEFIIEGSIEFKYKEKFGDVEE